jgi:hypothetical protein
MKHEKLAMAILVAASLAVPTAHAKKKAPAPTPPVVTPAPNSGSQAGGLPATNARVTALEAAVVALRGDLTAEIAARQAADLRLAHALSDEIAARQAADTALANKLAGIPQVFVGTGSVNNLKGTTATVASKSVPAGTYFILASIQMVNGQSSGDANARCVMRADGNLLADTTDLQFPLLSAPSGTASGAFGSTMFAPLQGSFSSTSPIAIRVDCTENKGANGGLDAYVQIAAVKAGVIQ